MEGYNTQSKAKIKYNQSNIGSTNVGSATHSWITTHLLKNTNNCSLYSNILKLLFFLKYQNANDEHGLCEVMNLLLNLSKNEKKILSEHLATYIISKKINSLSLSNLRVISFGSGCLTYWARFVGLDRNPPHEVADLKLISRGSGWLAPYCLAKKGWILFLCHIVMV